MAHYAQVDDQNVVTRVIVIPDEHETDGESYITESLGLPGVWVQTSYTSHAGRRVDPDTNEPVEGEHFRFNFAGEGFTWDPEMGPDGAFIPPKPDGMDSWVLDMDMARWVPPVSPPESVDADGNVIFWEWDEASLSWVVGLTVPPPNEA